MKSLTCFWAVLLTVLLLSCDGDGDLNDANAVYYWRTEWRLDSTERAFLRQYDIHRVYCRYFDVVIPEEGHEPMPNATISFADEVPQGITLIPTVYITENCMHHLYKADTLATNIVNRIVQMNQTHGIKGVTEIQMDCDYTSRSRQTYYAFLEKVRQQARHHGLRLSVTIRLHQLAMKAPPADYGVLMLYNTGDPRKFMQRNPILDLRDVQPYLNRLDDYPLPLAAAYPVYRWPRTIQGVSIDHTVEAEEILRTKKAVEKKRPRLSRTIITYHLDTENINRYTPETYEEIYRH